jgi:hypothetical protein
MIKITAGLMAALLAATPTWAQPNDGNADAAYLATLRGDVITPRNPFDACMIGEACFDRGRQHYDPAGAERSCREIMNKYNLR